MHLTDSLTTNISGPHKPDIGTCRLPNNSETRLCGIPNSRWKVAALKVGMGPSAQVPLRDCRAGWRLAGRRNGAREDHRGAPVPNHAMAWEAGGPGAATPSAEWEGSPRLWWGWGGAGKPPPSGKWSLILPEWPAGTTIVGQAGARGRLPLPQSGRCETAPGTTRAQHPWLA
jgi:hypothetical protein